MAEPKKKVFAIEYRDPNTLTPYFRNAKKHPTQQIDHIAASIAEFNFDQPIVVDGKGVIIKGHGRREAAIRLQIAKVPVIVRDDLTATQAKAARLADNKVAESEWDLDLLKLELDDIHIEGFSLDDGGLDSFDFAELGRDTTEGRTDPDDVPEPPKDPITKTGDLWILGDHRLLCGDSTKKEDFERLMGGEKAALIVTDPPYGVDYVGKTKEKLVVHNDGKEGLAKLLKSCFELVINNSHNGACWYVAAPPGPQFLDFAKILSDLEVWHQSIVWAKNSLVMGHSDYHYQHEAIFYGWTPGAAHKAPPDRKQTTLWFFDRPTKSIEHPTMKPVALFERAIGNSSTVGSFCLDPFLGSGTTIIACEKTGRKCFGMEISPLYVDVCVRRWEEFTGKKAVLENAL